MFGLVCRRGKSGTFFENHAEVLSGFVAGVLTWGGLKSILVIFDNGMSTLAYSIKHTQCIRIIIFTTSVCWLVYNLCVKSYTGAMCEALTLCSIISGFIRFDIYPRMRCFAAVRENEEL